MEVLSTSVLPLVCPLTPLEPHWNLIGISLEPHRNISAAKTRELRKKNDINAKRVAYRGNSVCGPAWA